MERLTVQEADSSQVGTDFTLEECIVRFGCRTFSHEDSGADPRAREDFADFICVDNVFDGSDDW